MESVAIDHQKYTAKTADCFGRRHGRCRKDDCEEVVWLGSTTERS